MIHNYRISLISISLLYKYSSYDYRVIFCMSNCVYNFMCHSVLCGSCALEQYRVVGLGGWSESVDVCVFSENCGM